MSPYDARTLALVILHWRSVAAFLERLWDRIETIFEEGWHAIKPIVDAISRSESLLPKVPSGWRPGGAELMGAWGAAQEGMGAPGMRASLPAAPRPALPPLTINVRNAPAGRPRASTDRRRRSTSISPRPSARMRFQRDPKARSAIPISSFGVVPRACDHWSKNAVGLSRRPQDALARRSDTELVARRSHSLPL